MTPQEQQMIDGLISRIRNTDVHDKDTQAEQHIQGSLSGYPDALYVLVQTVLVQQYGLDQAQAQLRELKQQVETLRAQAQQVPQTQRSSSGSFLSHIFGTDSQPPQPAPPQGYQPVNYPGSQGYAPPPPPPYPGQGYPAGGGGLFGGGGPFGGGAGGGGFLRGAMQTAAGVAAGELAFQGMEDLFRGFGGHEHGLVGGGTGETVVNNYYDQDREADRDTGDRGSFYNTEDDASRNDTGSDLSGSDNFGSDNFADAGNDDSTFGDSSDSDSFDSGNDFSGDNS